MPYLGVSSSNFRKLLSYLKSALSNFQSKIHLKAKIGNLPKHLLFGYPWVRIWKICWHF